MILCSLITSPNLTFGFGTSLGLGLGIGGPNLGLELDKKPGFRYKGFLKILMIFYKPPSEIQESIVRFYASNPSFKQGFIGNQKTNRGTGGFIIRPL